MPVQLPYVGRRRAHTPRTVVVTGASAGVGRATARRFGAMGDRVALLARGETGLQAAADEIRAAGGRALVVPVDVADHKAVDDAADRVEAEFGPLDVWVNAAFSSVFAPFTEIDPEEFRRATEVTYLGYVFCTRAALRRMLPRDHGTVVQVGSALAYRGIPLQSAYCGAKHAIQGFNEAVRCELLHSGTSVRVTMVQLPAVNTPQFDWLLTRLPRRARPVAPVYQPEVAALSIAHAAEYPGRREYWVGASTAATLVANAVAPGLLDRYLAHTGFDSQQSPEEQPSDSPVNLWEPADGVGGPDFGAHGRFDGQSHRHSAQAWASRRHGLVGAATALGAGAAGLLAARAVSSRRR